jgi:hypothetical protein
MAHTASPEKDIEIVQPSPTLLPSETSSQLDDTYETYKNNQGVGYEAAEAKKTQNHPHLVLHISSTVSG